MSDTSFTEIDEDRLDLECLRQPKRYYKYATMLADAQQVLAEAKAELDITKADLANAIRNDPEEYEMTKVTEASVAAAVICQDEYGTALQIVHDAKHEVDVLQAAVVSLDHRKRMLQNLIALHGQNYFASPQLTTEEQEVIDEFRRKRRKKK